jgi:predicted RNase H-like HicB family nuclease
MDGAAHEEILRAANELAASREGTFKVNDIVRRLPHLNESTVRTHVVSRCCVNAPTNHPHKWDYFRRVGRGLYQVMPQYRRPDASAGSIEAGATTKAGAGRRETIHALVHQDGGVYAVECLELAVVTQGRSLDEAVSSLQQALALHLEGEDLAALGLAENLRVEVIYDMPLTS